MKNLSLSALRAHCIISILAFIILVHNGCKKDQEIKISKEQANILADEDFLNWVNTKRPEWLAYLLPTNNVVTKLGQQNSIGILVTNLEQLKTARQVYKERLAVKLQIDIEEVEVQLKKHYDDNAKKLDSLVLKTMSFNKTWPVYQQLNLKKGMTSKARTMSSGRRSDLNDVEITACRVSHLYSMIQDLNNLATTGDCIDILFQISAAIDRMTNASNPSLFECSSMELNIFSLISQYRNCLLRNNPNLGIGGGPGGTGGTGGGPGTGSTGPIFGENGSNAVVSLAKFLELIQYVLLNGYKVTEPFETSMTINGIRYDGTMVEIYNSEGDIIAAYFTPNSNSTLFPIGFYYSIGSPTQSLNTPIFNLPTAFSLDFGSPIIPDGPYPGSARRTAVIPEAPADYAPTPIISNGIEISDAPSINNTAPPLKLIGMTTDRGNTEDLTFGTNGNPAGFDQSIYIPISNYDQQRLFVAMRNLMDWGTMYNSELRQVAYSFIDTFNTNNSANNQISDPSLNANVEVCSEFISFLKLFGAKFRDELDANNGNYNNINPIDMGETRPVFNGRYNMFHGLTILLNDTEKTEIRLESFQTYPGGKWEAVVQVTIYDHFGMDRNDLINAQDRHDGFTAWWVLQHRRAKVPFITKVVARKKIKNFR